MLDYISDQESGTDCWPGRLKMLTLSPKNIFGATLLLLLCLPPRVNAVDPDCEILHTQRVCIDMDIALLSLQLQEVLHDKVQSVQLLKDPVCMRNVLKLKEFRSELLRHPHFVRQMIQSREMRRELLQNEQMVSEMLQNRDIQSEINRNLEMMEELEKNAAYRQENLERQAEALEEQLLEPVVTGGAQNK